MLRAACAAAVGVSCLAGSPAAITLPKPPTDEAVGFSVDDALTLSGVIPANELDVKAVQGIVTMRGTVDNLLAKDDAVKIAKTIHGVRAVIDATKVQAPVRSDDEIRKDVEDALHHDDATTLLQLTVAAHDGKVTVTGKAPSRVEQQAALADAMRIRGVNEVSSNIELVYGGPRSDLEIQADGRRALKMDPSVDSVFVNFEVENGVVKLSGTVGTATEGDRCFDDAWIAGVRSVNADDLKVEPTIKPDLRKRQSPELKTDEQIRSAIADALRYDPRILAEDIVVAVADGQVTLAGTVRHHKSKAEAGSDAKDTPGVFSVRNLIKVRPNTRPSDEHLARDIKQALIRDSRVGCFDLHEAAVSGVVTLSGMVDYSPQRAEAEYLAEQAVGVVEVRNDIHVKYAHGNQPPLSDSLPADPKH